MEIKSRLVLPGNGGRGELGDMELFFGVIVDSGDGRKIL